VPLANRVDPLGRLFAAAERGDLLGNRGGRFHDPATRTVRGRAWVSKRWICCRLAFKDRQRAVWGQGYTELFFADEVSALAAGHRPCFECRREDATAFAAAWGRALGEPPPRADAMDARLHAERLLPDGGKRLHRLNTAALPPGAVLLIDGEPWGLDEAGLRPWRFDGFGPLRRPPPSGEAIVATPPSILAAIASGYRPRWRLRET
jgi:hypothetical protein